jgi:hypothetical protein
MKAVGLVVAVVATAAAVQVRVDEQALGNWLNS